MSAPTLVVQTTYAELLERCTAATFDQAFPESGSFAVKTLKGRRYWYFQTQTEQGRVQRYVGPETPELLERIAQHKRTRDDERERRALVSTLVRSFGLPRPLPEIGELVSTLARAGVFRVRSVLIGTVAYQTFPAMLGVKLPGALLQTSDIDIAQFKSVSIAIQDQIPPLLEVLKNVDKTFRAVPRVGQHNAATSYVAKGGLRIDVLTPNEGPNTDQAQALPALQSDAEPLRFLDFLIYEPQHAVLLHNDGVLVTVPAPERFAVHKLIVSIRRPVGTAKRDKDLSQAGALLEVLAEKRPIELADAWKEASQRGKKWSQLLLEGASRLAARSRDITLKVVKLNRDALPGIQLTFDDPRPRYDSTRDVILFNGEALGTRVTCAVPREVLEDHFNADNMTEKQRVEIFVKNRSKFERMAKTKYLHWPIEEPETVLIRTTEVAKLL
jgi:hypothetical protein